MTESSIAFEGTISEELFVHAQRLHLGRRQLLLPLVIAASIIATWVIFAEALFLTKVLFTVGALALVPLVAIVQRRQWKLVYNRTTYLQEPIRGEVSDWGLRSESSMAKSEVPWPKLVKYKMDDRMMLLYQGPNVMHLIAAEFFATKNDWNKARQLIVERSGLKVG